MLKITDLSIIHLLSGRTLVSGLSFCAQTGTKIAVVGAEGVGKSTLLKVLAGQAPDPVFEIHGDVESTGPIGYLPQDPPPEAHGLSTFDYLLRENLYEAIPLDNYEMLPQISIALKRVGFDISAYNEDKLYDDYSGGEKIKLGLVRLLIRDPSIILLDEPTNNLDLSTVDFLTEFIRTEERPLIYTSHDEYLLKSTATAVIHLEQIKNRTENRTTFAALPYEQYLEKRSNYRARARQIGLKQRADYAEKMEHFRTIYSKVESKQNQAVRSPHESKMLKRKIKALKVFENRIEQEKEGFVEIPEDDEFINVFFDKSQAVPSGKTVFDIRNLTLEAGGRILAQNINLTVKGPEHIAVIGPNGCGKSTLLRTLAKTALDRTDLIFGYMPQDYAEVLDYEKSALENLTSSAERSEVGRIRSMMGALSFETDEMTAPVKEISGGQKAKLLILKLILRQSQVLLLDEPTRNLSPLNCPEIYRLIDTFKGAVIAVTHDREFLNRSFKKVLTLEQDGLKPRKDQV